MHNIKTKNWIHIYFADCQECHTIIAHMDTGSYVYV